MRYSIVSSIIALLLFFGVAAHAETSVIHVVVALCDNKNQGIVKVPAKLGNGQDPANNLYWGALYGVKTFMSKQKEWQIINKSNLNDKHILERAVYKHTSKDLYMVADAYDGKYIKQTVTDFLDYSAGLNGQVINADNVSVSAGGKAELIVYIGHNGLMDFFMPFNPKATNSNKREAAVFACKSNSYFEKPLKKAGAEPLILTTGLMAPEAYNLYALVTAWSDGKTPEAIKEDVAQAYNRYQKCGINAARKLFRTGGND